MGIFIPFLKPCLLQNSGLGGRLALRKWEKDKIEKEVRGAKEVRKEDRFSFMSYLCISDGFGPSEVTSLPGNIRLIKLIFNGQADEWKTAIEADLEASWTI